MSAEIDQSDWDSMTVEEELEGVDRIPDELIVDHAYLVARGVRLLAVIGTVRNTEMATDVMNQRLAKIAAESAGTQELYPIPLLMGEEGCEWATVGFASHEWVINAYEWLQGDDVPGDIANRLIGLLHGYSGEAISKFGRNTSGWRTSRAT